MYTWSIWNSPTWNKIDPHAKPSCRVRSFEVPITFATLYTQNKNTNTLTCFSLHIYIYMCIYIYINIYICICTYVYAHLHWCTYIHWIISIPLLFYIYIYMSMSVMYMLICFWICKWQLHLWHLGSIQSLISAHSAGLVYFNTCDTLPRFPTLAVYTAGNEPTYTEGGFYNVFQLSWSSIPAVLKSCASWR